ncbi:MAG: hypothetical protein GY757_07130, partial [bacterium]|nr:hypothetical protein [bacterium]
MIRIAVEYEVLKELVKKESPSWLERAQEKTGKFKELGKYSDKSPIWSDIKPVFMQIQNN